MCPSVAIKIIFLSHPHGCVSWNLLCSHCRDKRFSHTLTGVWVEIAIVKCTCKEIRHTLTGVWVEIQQFYRRSCSKNVTPSRVCELKCQMRIPIIPAISHTLTGVWVEIGHFKDVYFNTASHPHGCVSWNKKWNDLGHTVYVTPSRVCELKSIKIKLSVLKFAVTPSRVCELKWYSS